MWNDVDVAVDVFASIGEPSSVSSDGSKICPQDAMDTRSFLRTWDIVSLYGVPLFCEMSETNLVQFRCFLYHLKKYIFSAHKEQDSMKHGEKWFPDKLWNFFDIKFFVSSHSRYVPIRV